MATNMTHLAPLNLAGLLFGDPCPLRWLPADARRMPRADSAEAAGEFFWRAGVGSRVGRVRRRVAKAGNCLRGGELSASRACGCGREARRGAGGGGLGDRGRGLGPPASGRPTRRRATNRLAELEPGRRRRGSMSSRVRPDGAAALLAGGPVRARRARREVDGRRFFVDKGQFTADVRAVVVTVRGILDHFAQQGASGHGMVFAQDRCHAS